MLYSIICINLFVSTVSSNTVISKNKVKVFLNCLLLQTPPTYQFDQCLDGRDSRESYRNIDIHWPVYQHRHTQSFNMKIPGCNFRKHSVDWNSVSVRKWLHFTFDFVQSLFPVAYSFDVSTALFWHLPYGSSEAPYKYK